MITGKINGTVTQQFFIEKGDTLKPMSVIIVN